MADHTPNIQVLQASVDPDTSGEFRLLVDHKFVKYITIDAGLYDCEDMCFAPSLIALLPPFPTGDWNQGHIARNPETGDAYFSTVSKKHLLGITETWHPTHIDHLQLHTQEKLRSNVYEVTCPGFDTPVIAKFARFEWEVPQLQAETTAYGWIDGEHIGPDFLGHLTEDDGRVIGFLVARIADDDDGARHATPEDLPLCRAALARLHQLGIKHGDTNKHNFLIHHGEATLIDFDGASRPAAEEELQAELDALQDQFCDMSGRGGQFVVE